MPLVRINLSDSYSADERQIIGDTVYSAMVDIGKAPAGDKFLIFTRHADGELIQLSTSPKLVLSWQEKGTVITVKAIGAKKGYLAGASTVSAATVAIK